MEVKPSRRFKPSREIETSGETSGLDILLVQALKDAMPWYEEAACQDADSEIFFREFRPAGRPRKDWKNCSPSPENIATSAMSKTTASGMP